jgi:hypothetical protein
VACNGARTTPSSAARTPARLFTTRLNDVGVPLFRTGRLGVSADELEEVRSAYLYDALGRVVVCRPLGLLGPGNW